MTATKKNAVKTLKKAAPSKSAPKKTASKSRAVKDKPIYINKDEELMAANIAALSKVIEALGLTLEMLVQKTESMAYHIIATEEILAEIVASNGLNLARVNARIRSKIAAGTDSHGNADQAIDVAAAIASPLPRR